jgi:alpha-2-macroglobulin family protein
VKTIAGRMRWLPIAIAISALVDCRKLERSNTAPRSEPAFERESKEAEADARGGGAGGARADKKRKLAPSAPASAKPAPKTEAFAGHLEANAALGSVAAVDAAPEASADGEGGGSAAAKPRAWFPETFLFEPLIVTDDAGSARVHVRVPDRLTTWRILALAHSREGAQAGAETSFLGTLPVYVDPVLPTFLMADDAAQIPVQVVNTTERALERTLVLEAGGAASLHAKLAVEVPAASSRVEHASLRAIRPGRILFKAALGDKDAVEKTVTVFPSGRPNVQNHGGTLAAPRTIEVEIPADAEKDASSVRLLVFPGGLALLRSELAQASSRGGAAADAYALLLAGKGEALLRSLGGEPDLKALRNLAIIAGQRAIRDARSPSAGTAALLAEAALAHPDNPVIGRLGERLADTVARSQRPDGTFAGETGWTLQRLLVASADGVRAVLAAHESSAQKQRAERVRLLAEGAFERNLERVEDAYTAAAIAASGAVDGSIAERLRQKIRDKIAKTKDGGASLVPESGVTRADGLEPSSVEATALAVLALIGDDNAKAILPDLGATLLAAYDPRRGWGDGETNLAALRAVLALFKNPLPAKVKVTLSLDDRALGEGVLEGARLREVFPIDADLPNTSGKHTFRIVSDPPVPGLGYSITWRTYEPWKAVEGEKGMELSVEAPKSLTVGKSAEIAVVASAAAGIALSLRISLPAGVEPDKPSLDALVSSGVVLSYRTEEGAVSFEARAREPGQTFEARFKVIATLAGKLHSGPSTIHAAQGGEEFYATPRTWTIVER